MSAEREEERECTHCESKFVLRYPVTLDKPDLCPFCGSETELAKDDDDEYDDENDDD
jgi:rRNA maturation endonuclease Nob1